MPDPLVPADVAELSERAVGTHVVVVGAGVAGLVAARVFAKVGMRVTVLEAEEHPGGTVARAELDGIEVDAAADSFAPGNDRLEALLDELDLLADVVEADRQPTWVVDGSDAAPLPARAVAGIPENPFADDVRRVIGWRGAWRAYLDRMRPPLTIGQEESLGRLVEKRMGALVRDRLVAPVSLGVYGTHPDDIRTDAAAPGLNAALTRTGSLSGAVGALLHERTAAPLQSLRGGIHRLIDALVADVLAQGVDVRRNSPVAAVTRTDAAWEIAIDGAEEQLHADAVFLAVPGEVAAQLLPDEIPTPEGALATAPVEVVTLLVESDALDAAPRGTRVVSMPGSGRRAQSVIHATASWPWLHEALGAPHLLRVTFGGGAPATAAMNDTDAADLAVSEASALLGVPTLTLIEAHRTRAAQATPVSVLGGPQARSGIREQLAERAALGVAGSWLAGSGLAQVIPDALAEAERLRHELLWKEQPL